MSERGAPSRKQRKSLIEIKGGLMIVQDTVVRPDRRKGVLFIYQSKDLLHFCWRDRLTGAVEVDLIIFPEESVFERVPECASGRVYALNFKSANRQLYFWVQERNGTKNEDNCRKVNEILNNPHTPGSQRGGRGTPRSDEDIEHMLTNMSQQQEKLFGFGQLGELPSLPSMSPPSTRQSPHPSSAAATATITTTNINSGSNTSATTGSSSTTAATAEASATSTTALEPAKTTGEPTIRFSYKYLLRTNTLGEARSKQRPLVKELQKHLPTVTTEGSATPTPIEQLVSTLSSPQFQQASGMPLPSGHLEPTVQPFEVGTKAVTAANQGSNEEEEEQKKNKEGDGDGVMFLD